MAAHQYSRDVIRYEQRDLPVILNFDTWTPRSHFAIVQKQPKMYASEQELGAAFILVDRFLRNYPEFDQNKAMISFHGGKWYGAADSTSKWHVHLVVPWDPYLKEAEQWVTFTLRNKQWCKATRYTDAMKTRKWREVEKYNEYKLNFLNDVSSGKIRNHAIDLTRFESPQFGLLWTRSSIEYPFPFIGITIKPSSYRPYQQDLYAFLEQLRSNLASINNFFYNFGCHMCIFVTAASQGTVSERTCDAFSAEDGSPCQARIVGYLLVEDSCYYAWLPDALKRAWLQSFEHCPHIVDS